MSDRVGQQVGHYRLLQLLGQEEFAEVYQGEDIRLDRPVAIKVFRTHLSAEDEAHFRFEARTIARLAHPNTVQIYDFGIENGISYLVMDYLPNGTLRRQHPRGTPLPLATIVTYVKAIANAYSMLMTINSYIVTSSQRTCSWGETMKFC